MVNIGSAPKRSQNTATAEVTGRCPPVHILLEQVHLDHAALVVQVTERRTCKGKVQLVAIQIETEWVPGGVE